eukprot:c6752_g1_i2.p1 GENE.c6752_g1_i2~~c6752_g1_i2.p1  ORF type:complete len:543 (+),score=132.35 c6752_g1_i2:197-1630(+)
MTNEEESRQMLELSNWSLESAIATHFEIHAGNLDCGQAPPAASASRLTRPQIQSQIQSQQQQIPQTASRELLSLRHTRIFRLPYVSWIFSSLTSRFFNVVTFFSQFIPSPIIRLLSIPFNIKSLRMLASPAPRPVPRSMAAISSSQFRTKLVDYSELYPELSHPLFYPGTFREALRAARDNFRFLLVIIHSDQNRGCSVFCRQTLCDPELVAFINSNFVLWFGDVANSEAFGLQASLGARDLPLVAVMGSVNGQQVALQKSEGFVTATELIATLQNALNEHGAVLVAARLDSEERATARLLREEQDRDYQEALLMEQLKEQEARERQLQEEQAVLQRAEEESRRVADQERRDQLRLERKEAKRLGLPAEPARGAGVVSVAIRTPASRLQRRFLVSDKIQIIMDFVESETDATFESGGDCECSTMANTTDLTTHERAPELKWCLVTTHPRRVCNGCDTLQQAGITDSLVLALESLPTQ